MGTRAQNAALVAAVGLMLLTLALLALVAGLRLAREVQQEPIPIQIYYCDGDPVQCRKDVP